MDKIVGEYFVNEGKILKAEVFNHQFTPSPYPFYEVLRVASAAPLFLEDHITRLRNSLLSRIGVEPEFADRVGSTVRDIISANQGREGNIKLLCRGAAEKIYLTGYYIPHSYPTPEMSTQGVKLITFAVERPDPHLKQTSVSENIRQLIQNAMEEQKAYEVLLENQSGMITEGSRSNFFLIRKNVLYTAPDELILKGITRSKVLQIAKKEKIQVHFIAAQTKQLAGYEAAFLCGTSPKILPVRSINEVTYSTQNELTGFLQEKYDDLIATCVAGYNSRI